MSEYTVKIHNVETNEVIEREMTAAEITQYKKDIATLEKEREQELQKEQAKKALLQKLGITEQEAKLLLS